jgi:hypothetical protein
MNLHRWFATAILLTVLGILFIEANAEPLGRIFWHLLTIHDLPAAWLMLAVLLFGYWVAAGGKGNEVRADHLLRGLDHQRYPLAILLFGLLCIGSLTVYRNHPLSMDEYAAVFQAKIYATGAMTGHFPPELLDNLIPREFQNEFLMVNRQTGAVFSGYWPGFSLLLAPFVWLGIPWACNPALVAVSLLMIARIARELIATPTVAGWAMLLALASPGFVANGITYYSMPAHLLLNLCFAWLLLSRSSLRLFLAGVVGGFAMALHNPFPHAVFALPWLVWLATRRGEWHRHLAWIGLGYLLTALPLVMGWSLWLRHAIQGPVPADIPQPVAVIGPEMRERAALVIQGFFRVLQWPGELIVYARLGGLVKLWLWASPLLLLLAWWGGRESRSAPLRLLGASALCTFFAYFLIRFNQGHGWGYRYFHSAWGVLPVLGAAGIVKLAAQQNDGPRWERAIAILSLASLIFANGLRFWQIQTFIDVHLAQFPPGAEGKQSLIWKNGRGYYGNDLVQNDPWLRGDVVVFTARSQQEADKVLAHFPGTYAKLSNRFGDTFVGKEIEP